MILSIKMKRNVLLAALLLIVSMRQSKASAQNNVIKMKTNTSTLRLIYPQWQGGGTCLSGLVPELKPEDAACGYFLGSQLLNILAPEIKQTTVQVPVSMDIMP